MSNPHSNNILTQSSALTMNYRTHLNVLENSAALYASSAAFRLPRLSADNSKVEAWDTVSYEQFLRDVEHAARYWSHALSAHGLARRPIVGLW